MSEKTGISWTDHTFNPWWGCVKVSPACVNCYAERDSNRYGFKVWGPESERRFFGPKHWEEPLRWNKKAVVDGVRRRVFCASMADVFEDRPDLVQSRADLFLTIEETPALDWLLLTKRPDNIRRLMPKWWNGRPWPNVWMGTTVENQEWADKRIPWLVDVPAVVRFISYEPACGPLDLTRLQLIRPIGNRPSAWLNALTGHYVGPDDITPDRIHWVIAGGESGPKAKPSHPDWFRSVRNQCASAAVAFHFKQWGEWQDGSAPPSNFGEIVMNDGEHHVSQAEFPRYTETEWASKHPVVMARVGKKRAGRELDGTVWDQFPSVRDESDVVRG